MQRLLIIGAGDVAQRLLPEIHRRYRRIYVLLRRPEAAAAWRAQGVIPVWGDLDDYHSLQRLAGLADQVLHLAPPPDSGVFDSRTRHLALALSCRGSLPHRFGYISTSGVYGDCQGARVPETRPPRPLTARGQRRLDAERTLRQWAGPRGIRLSILRTPGIYAIDRLPLQRLHNATPLLLSQDDSYSNHIHADDLARLAALSLWRGKPGRVYHACDSQPMKMGEYFDLVADYAGLPRAPRLPRVEVEARLSPMQLSFLRESRQLDNRRLRTELRVHLRYPSVHVLLQKQAK